MRKTDRIFLCILKHFILATLLTVKVLWSGDSGGRGWGEVGMGVGRVGGSAMRCGIPEATPGCGTAGADAAAASGAAAASPASPSPGLRVYSRTNQSDMMVVAD